MIGADPQGKAFQYLLGSHGVAYLPHREIEASEAIALISASEGIPVLAHPGRMKGTDLLRTLVDWGLGGLEVYYPTHTAAQTRRFERLAKRFNLIATGGSDFHGDEEGPALGAARAPVELLRILRGRGE